MLKLTSKKFEVTSSASKPVEKGCSNLPKGASNIDLEAAAVNLRSSSPNAFKRTEEYEIDTTFGFDFSKDKLSNSQLVKDEDLHERDISTHFSNNSDTSFEESEDDGNVSKISINSKNLGSIIGVGPNGSDSATDPCHTYQSYDGKCGAIGGTDTTRGAVESSSTKSNLIPFDGKTNSIINESNLSEDEKPKKKTRRGGKRAKRQRMKRAAVEAELGIQPELPAPVTQEPKKEVKYKTEL